MVKEPPNISTTATIRITVSGFCTNYYETNIDEKTTHNMVVHIGALEYIEKRN